MILNFKRISILSLAVALAAACEPEALAPDSSAPQQVVLGQDVVRGELLIRFDERVVGILDEAGLTRSGSKAPLSECPIPSVEEVLSMVEGYTIERVFPVDPRSEKLARKEGLHLWYRVKFAEDAPMEQMIAKLSRLGEVSTVNCNRRLRKNWSEKVIPFDPASRTTGLASSPNAAPTRATTPRFNDGGLQYQWHLVNKGDLGATKFTAGADVNVLPAWDLCTGDPSIIVAVLDEGIAYDHPDLKDAMWVNEDEVWRSRTDNDGNGYPGDVYGYNFALDTPIITVNDIKDSGHGSHVAGVIAATNNNGVGISSIAGGDGISKGVRLMSCQIFSGDKGGTVLDEVRAIKYAADNGATILQCSWGYTSGAANGYDWQPMYSTDETWMSDNALEKKALDYFVHNAGSPDGVVEGGIAVFAAGNESAPAAGYPGAYGDFVSVAATAADWTPAVYTNYGTGTTISAPGGDQDYYYEYGEGSDCGAIGCVLSTLPLEVTPVGYGYMEGTSMACPHVSGVFALGLSYAAKLHKHFKAEEIIELLYSTATPVEQFWNVDEPKNYYKYVVDLGSNHFKSMDLKLFRGKMGHGQVNAAAFLDAISKGGKPMTFPNVFLAPGAEKLIDASLYFDNVGSMTLDFKTSPVASAQLSAGKLHIKGLAEGQAKGRISDGSRSFDFVVTVRKNANSNGWL